MVSEVLKAYACYNNDEKIRLKSTSGGIFFLLSSYILEKGGVIARAAFDNMYNVKHIIADNYEDLEQILGSKYPQSSMGDIYEKIARYLKNDQYVLYCGTPCQNAGLLSFLGHHPEKLWLVDFVCHGVASPELWRDYLNYKFPNALPRYIRFKDKKFGWKNWHVHFRLDDIDLYEKGLDNIFMKSYLDRINIRPSCFECRFKGLMRNTDFTIADCWGIGEKNVKLNDDKGLSAVLIHSERGLKVFNELSPKLIFQEYEPRELLEENWAAIRSTEMNNKRVLFFECYKKRGSITFDLFWNNKIIYKIYRKLKGFELWMKKRR